MTVQGSRSATGLLLPSLALVACVPLAGVPTRGVAAEFCATGVAGTATSCEAAWELAQDLARRRSDRTLTVDPAKERLRRLDHGGGQHGDAAAPFAMSGEGDNISFNTSLTQWGSALSAADLESLKQAQGAAGDAALPKAAASRPPKFDMWAQGRRERFNEDGAKRGNALTTFLGADYRLHGNLLIGGMVQLDDSHQTILAAPNASDGTAYMAGPYVAYRLTPNVMLDAKAAWGTAHDNAATGTGDLKLATTRSLSEARLTGQWGWNAWQLSQSGAVTYLDDARYSGIPGGPDTSLEVTRFSVGPELKRQFDTSNGASIEPFAFFKSSLNLGESGWAAPAGQNTVGGGVLLAKPDKYKIRAGADFTESLSGTDEIATGRVSVSVPASLLGF
jgi:hypothetical protein